MRQLFLSHNAADADIASRLRQALLAELPTYRIHQSSDFAAGPEAGTSWRSWIGSSLSVSDLVIFLVGSEPESPWCSAELGMATLLDRPILPLRAAGSTGTNAVIADLQAVPVDQPAKDLVKLIERRLGADDGPVGPLPADFEPFPGLRPFTEAQAALLFGRKADIKQIVDDLDPQGTGAGSRFVVVSGPSGSGKSSLVRAGVVPVLRARDWAIVGPTRPSQLAPGSLAAPEFNAPTLIVIDQAEELSVLDPSQRKAQEAWMGDLLDDGHRLLLTVRNEFRDEVGKHLPRPSDHYVPFLGRDELYEIIREPARLANVTVSERLIDRLVGETGSGAALPFLAYALRQLWDERDKKHSRLVEDSLDRRGGVQGLLNARARDALRKATGGHRSEEAGVLAALTLLASPDTNPPTRSPLRVALVPEQARGWFDCFVEVGLVTYRTSYALEDELDTGTMPGGDDVVDAAHEALFSWQPLATAIRDQRTTNNTRQAILQAARQWHASNPRDSTLLISGDRLRFALSDFVGRDDEALQTFLDASKKHDSERRMRARLAKAVAVAAAAAGIFAVLAVIAAFQARDRQAEAESARKESQALRIVAEAHSLITSDRDMALLAAVAGYRYAPNNDTEGALHDVLSAPEGPLRYITGSEVRWDSLTPLGDGQAVAISTDRQLVAVDLRSRAVATVPIPELLGVGITVLAVSPDGSVAVAGVRSGGGWMTGRVDLGSSRAALVDHPAEIRAVAAYGGTIVFGDVTGGLYGVQADAEPPGRPRLIEQLASEVTAVAIAADNEWMAAASLTGVTLHRRQPSADGLVWDAGQALLTGEAGFPASEHLAFDPTTGDLFAVGSDPVIHRWLHSEDGYVEGTSIGPAQGAVHSLAVDDSRVLFTAGASGSIQRWGLDVGGAPIGASLQAHIGDVRRVAPLGSGELLSTDSDRAIVWDLRPSRSVEREAFLPTGWADEAVRGLIRGDGPLAVITADHRVLVDDGRVLAVPDGVWQGWWVSDGLVVDRRDTSRLAGGVSVWLVAPDEITMLGDELDADDVVGCLAALARGASIELLDVGNCGRPPVTLQLSSNADDGTRHVAQLALSPDQERLLVAYDDGTAEVRRTGDGSVTHSFDLVEPGVATSAVWADDTTVAIGHDGSGGVEVQRLDASSENAEVRFTVPHADAVRWLAVDGRRHRLVASGEDGTISTTDVDTGSPVGAPRSAAQRRSENDVDAMSRGIRLVDDGSVLLSIQGLQLTAWEQDPAHLVEQACDSAGRNLTAGEAAKLGVATDLGCSDQ